MNIARVLGALSIAFGFPGFIYAGHQGKVCEGFVYEDDGRRVIFFLKEETECIEPEEHASLKRAFHNIMFDLPQETRVTYSQESWTDERGVCHARLLLIENYAARDVLYALGRGAGATKAEAFQEALKNARESIAPLSRIKPKKA